MKNTPKIYKRKPIEVEALFLPAKGTIFEKSELAREFLGDLFSTKTSKGIVVKGRKGATVFIEWGTYIVKYPDGMITVCTKEQFAQYYEEVTQAS